MTDTSFDMGAFRAACDRSAAEVASWPQWKRDIAAAGAGKVAAQSVDPTDATDDVLSQLRAQIAALEQRCAALETRLRFVEGYRER